jgi:hypothetical protein
MKAEDQDFSSGIYRRVYAAAIRGKRINSVSIAAELLFWRLHMVADDYGTFEADPYLVKCLAMTRRRDVSEAQIAEAIKELSDAGLIETFTVADESFGCITDFLRFQPAGRNGRRVRKFPVSPSEDRQDMGNPGESCESKQFHVGPTTPTPPTTGSGTEPSTVGGSSKLGVVKTALDKQAIHDALVKVGVGEELAIKCADSPLSTLAIVKKQIAEVSSAGNVDNGPAVLAHRMRRLINGEPLHASRRGKAR